MIKGVFMENKAICRRVSAMLSLFIDNKVTYQERAFIEEHISNCKDCYKKYLYLKSLIKDLKDSYKHILELTQKKQEQKMFSIRAHERFLEALYPYVDNELSTVENQEFRDYLTNSKNAQRQLKNVYSLQRELKSSFDKTRKSFQKDLSSLVINSLKNRKSIAQNLLLKNSIFTHNAVKIAILSGLVLCAGYEIGILYDMYYSAPQNQAHSLKEDIAPYFENAQNLIRNVVVGSPNKRVFDKFSQ